MASQTADTKSSIKATKYRDSHQLYDVVFGSTTIKTLVTRIPEIADSWIRNMSRPENNNINVVGLDIEWRSRSLTGDHTRPSTLQFCTVQTAAGTKYFSPTNDGGKDHKCLIFQIYQCGKVPESIIGYLGDKSCVFVSDRMAYIEKKLDEHYKLGMAYHIDISKLVEIVKPNMPNAVRDSDWDKRYLDPKQVRYACLDAFVSYEEASRFINNNNGPVQIQIPHGVSLDGMVQYLFGKTTERAKMTTENELMEEDYLVIGNDDVHDEKEDDYDVILHNEVYDL